MFLAEVEKKNLAYRREKELKSQLIKKIIRERNNSKENLRAAEGLDTIRREREKKRKRYGKK